MKKILIFILLLPVLAFGAFFAFTQISSRTVTTSTQEPFVVPALGEEYTNATYNFSFKLPQGFTAREIAGEDGGTTVVVEDGKGQGIQIMITNFGEDLADLTEERIHADIPDLTITEPQVLEVGNNHKGLAFKSDNEAFDGASREVWFVFKGNLYQISTYDHLDPLLKAIFSTWQFL